MTSEVTGSPPSLRVRHVLVPVDGSDFALRAMPTARVLAERFGAGLHAISVAGDDEDAGRLRASTAAALGVDIGDDRARVVVGADVADEIVRRAEELGSCLVCLSTHGRGRLSGALMGSVARSVLQRSPGAVVALGPMADNPGWSPRPRNWPDPLSVPRIVACVDGSVASETVLAPSVAWARTLGMSLTILTVTGDQLSLARSDADSGDDSGSDTDGYIAELVQRWRSTVSEVDGVVVRDPIGLASGIRAHLDRRPAGLVAVTTHARSGMQRMRLGAAAANIVHASVAPCLVVPVLHEFADALHDPAGSGGPS